MKKLLTTILIVSMLLSTIAPGSVVAAELLAKNSSAAPERVGEVLTRREKNSDTYLLEDGSYECVVYAEDKYYEDASGKLVEIDHTLIEDSFESRGVSYRYANKAGDVIYRFADNTTAVEVVFGDYSMDLKLADSNVPKTNLGGYEQENNFKDFLLKGDNCIAYGDVLPGVDLIYAAGTGHLKEYVVLRDSSDSKQLSFSIDAGSLVAEQTDDGKIAFMNDEGQAVFELENLFAVDAAGAYTEDLEYVLSEDSLGQIIVTVVPSAEYLDAEERVYPVLIDPTVTVKGASYTNDTFISSAYPYSNYQYYAWLGTGRDNNYYVRRSYVKFAIPSGISSSDVTGAYVKLYKNNGATTSVKACRNTGSWTVGGLYWNNAPTYTTTNASSAVSPDTYGCCSMNITSIVKGWIAGTYSNYGVVIMDNVETGNSNWTSFCSSNANDTRLPELYINYSGPVIVNRMYSVYSQMMPFRSEFQHRMNCYGYALQVHSNVGDSSNPYLQQPGEFSSDSKTYQELDTEMRSLFYSDADDDAWIDLAEGGMMRDFSTLFTTYGSEWQMTTTTLSASIPSGYRKIALVGKTGYGGDYHFYLRHDDGTWSQKRGNYLSQNDSTDTGVAITDGNISTVAHEGGYDGNIRYYLITKPPIVDYLHENGHVASCVQTTTHFTDRSGDNMSKSRTISGSASTGTIYAYIDYREDGDYFKITPTTSATYTFSASTGGLSQSWLNMYIYGSNGSLITYYVTSGDPTITIALTAQETYFIRLRDDDEQITYPYTFTFSKQ